MITTNTGAKKLESSDNWREIFPNPGTSAAGAHNASVDAHDRIQAEVAPIINGKRCSLGAASGEYVLLRNSTITGKTDGAYQAAKAIPANTDLDSTYLGSPITGGLVNELNNNLTTLTEDVNNIRKVKRGDFTNVSIGTTGLVPIGLRYNHLIAVQIDGWVTSIFKDLNGYWYAYLTDASDGSHPSSGTVSGTYDYI